MARVPFTKLKCKINEDVVPVQIGEETITVKQYLPTQEKLKLISRVVNAAHEQDENYSNPVKVGVFRDLEIVFAYTNISFTDKQKEDLPKLYDMLHSSGILNEIIHSIPVSEYDEIIWGTRTTIEAIYKYQNSILGILDTIKTDYSDLKFDVEELKNNISDPESLGLLKNILTKLG